MAVYTEITDEEVQAFALEYDIGRVFACKGIAEGIENSNYLLVTEQGPFILTLYERRVKKEDFPFFHCADGASGGRGIPCPVPVRGRDGRALRTLAGRCAAVVTFLRGMWPKRPKASHCQALGEALARLHIAGRDFAMRTAATICRSGGGGRSTMRWRRPAGRGRSGPCRGATGELTTLERHWPRRCRRASSTPISFPDNVFFEGERLSGLIDFYFACTDYLAYDIAVCINAWCFEADGSFNVTKARR